MLRLWKMGVALVGIVAFGAMMAGSAWAEATTVCVPEAPSKPVVSPNAKGECPPKGKKLIKYKPVALSEGGEEGLTAEEKATLKAILPYIKFNETGVGGKPTVQFSGVNVQVVSGAGAGEHPQRRGEPGRRL